MRPLVCLAFVVPALCLAQEENLAGRLDELFQRRHEPAAAQEQQKLIEKALAESPNDYELLVRAARFNVWAADAATDDKQKSAIGKEAWDLADRARQLKPNDPRAHYFAASGVGVYSQGIGIMNAIAQGIEGKFNERLDKAIQLDPTIEQGGPWMVKGRYFFELPWPMRNLDKSEALLRKTLEKFPGNIRARTYLAETLLKDGEAKQAKAELEKVFNGPNTADTDETQRVRQMAKKLEAEIAKKL